MPLTLTDEEWEKAKTELEYMKKWSGWTERELPILHRLILQTPASDLSHKVGELEKQVAFLRLRVTVLEEDQDGKENA